MVELRKRKTPPPAPARPAKKKAGAKPATSRAGKAKAAVAAKVEAVKEVVTGGPNGAKKSAPAAGAPSVGDTKPKPFAALNHLRRVRMARPPSSLSNS